MKKKKSGMNKWIKWASASVLLVLVGTVIVIAVHMVFFPQNETGSNFYRDLGYMASPKTGSYSPGRDDSLGRAYLVQKAIEIEELERAQSQGDSEGK